MLKVSSVVVNGLLAESGLTYLDQSMYLWICALSPVSVRDLAQSVGVRWETARKACARLEAAGWLKIAEAGGLRPVISAPYAVQLAMGEELERGYGVAPNRGEYLMRELLDLLVAPQPYINNARQQSLLNPDTGRPLELDRLYPGKNVAFEFNATDHQQAAPPGDTGQLMQGVRARDRLKLRLCQEAGIKLVVVESHHLLPERFEALIPKILRPRYFDRSGPFWAVLTRLCAGYAARSAQNHPDAGRQAGGGV